jgi:hypothetical protein
VHPTRHRLHLWQWHPEGGLTMVHQRTKPGPISQGSFSASSMSS